jgi:opacity protein-like surface antigen
MLLAALCLLATGSEGLSLERAYGLQESPFWQTRIQRPPALAWETGALVLQGFFGASLYENFERIGGSAPDVDASSEDAAQMPVIGGGGQWKLAGSGLDIGFEGLFSFAGRANATAFAFGGMGGAIAVNIDMLVFELYGGPFVSCFLGDDARVYVGGGGLMQWVDYTQDVPSAGTEDSGSGYGTGSYVRAGIEFNVGDNLLVGFGVRWSESLVDLGPGLGELSLDGYQFLLTVTEGF